MSEPVKVNILDREFLVACPPEERAELLESADFLSARMRDVRDSGKIVGIERIAIMVALNITHEMLQARREADSGHAASDRLARLDRRIQDFLAEVDSALQR